ncbi:MAG: hypothetical protein DHS20C15_27410 [Planctomycetota bacterium]|nr:MAG: hypothetical protein DHS20C15_27410 [Planctomycetota bacterium]
MFAERVNRAASAEPVTTMPDEAHFRAAAPFQADVLALPVTDLDAASTWYAKAFGMHEVERRDSPNPTVVLERDGVQIGFAINGGDAAQDGAAVEVANIHDVRDELQANGVETANWRIDERNGERFQVFFVVAPDGLCYYFYERVPPTP